VQHGFESVRRTIEQNFDQLRSVFARYGLDLNRSVARRKAERARAARGWHGAVEPPDEAAEPSLRLVSADRS
jgi:hypothetical protein